MHAMQSCECAHKWRRTGAVARTPIGFEYSYRCERCERLLARYESPESARTVPRKFCGEEDATSPCNWPSCVAVPRNQLKQMRDSFIAFAWYLDARGPDDG